MGKGRKAKPKSILRLAGTYREDRHGSSPEATVSRAKCPDWLRGRSREAWPQIENLLRDMGLGSADYTIGIALLVDALADWIAACEDAAVCPPVHVTDKGNRVQDPTVGIKNKAWERVMKAACQFGMTPSAMRGVLKPGEGDAKEDMDKRMFGG